MTPSVNKSKYEEAMEQGKRKWGDKFVPPKVTTEQRAFFRGPRVEVVSPSGYTRRGVISITGGWQPVLILMHRKGDMGSSDILTTEDVIVAWIGNKSTRHEIKHDRLQVAVYQSQREES